MASEKSAWNLPMRSKRIEVSPAWRISDVEGVWNRGWTWAREAKKRRSRAAAKGIRAPERDEPTNVAAMLTAIPMETRVAPELPATRRMASTVGRSEVAIAVAGRTYWIAALVSM